MYITVHHVLIYALILVAGYFIGLGAVKLILKFRKSRPSLWVVKTENRGTPGDEA